MTEKKNKLRFNVIDLAVIVIIIGAIAGTAIRYNLISRISSTGTSEEASISFIASDLRLSSVDGFVEGDVFYWKQNGIRIGTLESKTRDYNEVYIHNSDFEIIKSYNEQRYDVRGVIKAVGSFTDDGFMLGGTQYIGPGKEMLVQSKNILVTITITDVNKISGD
ncbi:MAG: DUF4330 family protein [Clostridiales bacterium]|nr:DUF4330 family protein [Clostridiales bacterium]